MADNVIVVDLEIDDSKATKQLENIEKNTSKQIKQIAVKFDRDVSGSAAAASSELDTLLKTAVNLKTVLLSAPPIGKGLFGSITKITLLSGSLGLVAVGLDQINSKLARTSANLLRVASIITGGLAAAITFGIIKTSKLANQAGTSLVGTLRGIAEKSNKTQASLVVLTKVIDNYNIVTGGAIGETKAWTDQIGELSKSLNLTRQDLNKSAQEIISVGSQFGFSGKQLQKLLEISAEYAKVNHKEVFPVTLAITKAMAGNSQAVQALGIKLNQASVAAFAYKKGLSDNFKALDDNSKAQIRYAKLLSQFKNISGVAAVAAGTLADQQKALAVTVESFDSSFGKGVAQVENLNLASTALNKTLSLVSASAVESAGFMSALGARALQVTGFVVGLGIKLFILAKALKLIRVLMDANVSSFSLVSAQIPVLNQSLGSMIGFMTKGRVTTGALAAALTSLRAAVLSGVGSLGLLGAAGAKSFSILASLKAVFLSLGASVVKFGSFLVPLLAPLALIVAKVALLIGTFMVLKKAFMRLEEQTRFFSTAYKILLAELERSKSIVAPLINLFVNFKDVIVNLATKAFGTLVFAITKMMSVMAMVIEANPFGVFSEQTVLAFGAMQEKLDLFASRIQESGFLITEFSEGGKRDLAGLADSAGQSFNKVNASAAQFTKAFSQTIENGMVDVMSAGMARVGASLREGGSAFEGFASQVMGIMGDMLINLGKALIAKGLAIDALKLALSTLTGGAAIAAGLGLVALGGLLKSSGGGLVGATTGGGVSATGADSASESVIDIGEEEKAEKQTSLVINVEGALVQQQELGKFIAETLSDAGAKEGVVLTDTNLA